MNKQRQEQIISIIDDVRDMCIATVREDGFPQATEYESIDVSALSFFRIDPLVISLLDYRKGFGHTELLKV